MKVIDLLRNAVNESAGQNKNPIDVLSKELGLSSHLPQRICSIVVLETIADLIEEEYKERTCTVRRVGVDAQYDIYECDSCDKIIVSVSGMNYCTHCGAKVIKVANKHD